jgi:16S rRNA (guanine527-N7)-methyltransferase
MIEEGIMLDEAIIGKLDRFVELLEEWNRIHNLTGARTRSAIDENIADSLYPLTFIERPGNLLDVGTGAGFPGLVLAIALPETAVVLAEPLKKRSAFLRYAAMDMELQNVVVEGRRVEEMKHEAFELITSRAVTNTGLLLHLTENVSDAKTAYLFYKGERVFDEIEAARLHRPYEVFCKGRRNYLYIQGDQVPI